MNMLMENKGDNNHDMKVNAAGLLAPSMIFVSSNSCYDTSEITAQKKFAVLACDHFNKGNNYYLYSNL